MHYSINRNLLISILIVTVIVGLVVLIVRPQKKSDTSFSHYKAATVRIKNHDFTAYIADTDLLREKGLSDTSSLPHDAGMLFVFPKPDRYAFWMKDMKYSLDLLFINNDKVVDTLEHLSPETYPETFMGKTMYTMVFELADGTIASQNIRIGDVTKIQK